MNFEYHRDFAMALDKADTLANFRQAFWIPKHNNGEDIIYLCGNSLGLQPKTAKQNIEIELEDWKNLGVEGHFHGKRPWFHYHKFLTQHAAALVGATEKEVVVMNQLTVNLHLLLASFYNPTKEKYKIVMEAGAFPSDMYMVQSQIEWHGFKYEDAVLEITPREGEYTLREEDILDILDKNKDSIALVFFSGVQYYTGQYFNIPAITEKAHEIGALAGFDLAHAAGNMLLKLHEWKVDFAAWCSYKYLNSGPGNVSGIFIHEKHALNPATKRLAGWWGYNENTRFQMQKGYQPEPGAAGWQMSNAPVFGMAVHLASMELFSNAGMDQLFEKGQKLQKYFRFCLQTVFEKYPNFDVQIITPPDTHGCQISMIAKSNGKALFDYLTTEGIICDWREPEVIRMAAVPMYNTYLDVFTVAEKIEKYLQINYTVN